ncbi:MAG: SprT-like domain-containing protein [Blastocatellia bacterium]|nr:SprT-like domain-containing protein [Blastocatellia bacterium]
MNQLSLPSLAPTVQLESEMVETVRNLYRRLAPRTPIPTEIHVSFYPFVGLNNTIRLRQGKLLVRLSDLVKTAPVRVREAIAGILVAKLLKKAVPAEYSLIFQEFTQHPMIKKAMEQSRRQRGSKFITLAQGQYFDLDKLFDQINRQYFENQITRPTLTWSRNRTRRILGHYDRAHHTIAISRTLDSPQVPQFFVEFVLYHEMLHIKHKFQHVNGRTAIHTPEFRADEKLFQEYERSMKWMEQIPKLVKPAKPKVRAKSGAPKRSAH